MAIITATQAGDTKFKAAPPVVQTLTVNKMYYVDADGDGLGSDETKWLATEQTPAGYATNNQDCDDANAMQLAVTVDDSYALPLGVDVNTIYIGYTPASSLKLTASVSGGTAPYIYSWNNGATTEQINVSEAGAYTLAVTDAKGCQVTLAGGTPVKGPVSGNIASTVMDTKGAIVVKAVDIRCGNKNDKVQICHYSTGEKELCISAGDVLDHLNHGCKLGVCTSAVTSSASMRRDLFVEELTVAKVVLYPNPVTDLLTIKVGMVEAGAVVHLFDVNGAMVLSQRLVNTLQSISMKALSAGVYYVQVKNGTNVTIEKVIKQ